MALTTRAGKGSALTHAEMDANFTGLANGSLISGAINGTTLGQTTPAAGSFTTITGTTLGIGTGASPGAGQQAHVTGTGIQGVAAETTDNTTSSVAQLRALSAASLGYLQSHAAARTLTRYGLTLGGWVELFVDNNTGTNNGLIIGTQQNVPVVIGSNNTEIGRFSTSGFTTTGTFSSTGGSVPDVSTSKAWAIADRFGIVRAASSANERIWDAIVEATTLKIRAVNDAYSLSGVAITITRSGTTISSVALGGQVLAENGTNAAPAFSFSSDPDTGAYRSAANEYSIAAGGSRKATFAGSTLTLPSGIYIYTQEDTVSSATAVNGIQMGNVTISFGTGAPTHSRGQGSIYIRTDGSSSSTRLYVNTDSGTTWTAITTAT